MTNRTSPLTSLLLAVAAVLLVTAAGGSAVTGLGASTQQSAQATLPPPPPPPPGGGPGGLEVRRLDRLGLSAAQWDQVDTILEQARSAAEPYHERLRASRDAIRDAVQADVFDEAAVRTLAASEADATVEIAVIDARAQSAIYRVLTAEQRERLAKLATAPRPPRR